MTTTTSKDKKLSPEHIDYVKNFYKNYKIDNQHSKLFFLLAEKAEKGKLSDEENLNMIIIYKTVTTLIKARKAENKLNDIIKKGRAERAKLENGKKIIVGATAINLAKTDKN